MRLEIRVVPNAKKFSVLLKDGLIRVHVSAKAEDNNANAELVERLSEALGKKVSIARGAKGRAKVLEIEGNEDEILGKMREIAQAP